GCLSGGHVFGFLAAENSQAQPCRVSCFHLETGHVPTDDAVPEVRVVVSVNGNAGGLSDLYKRVTRHKEYPGAVLRDAEIDDDRVGRKLRKASSKVRHGKANQVAKFHSSFER